MEEPIWIFFGIIMVILGLGIVGNVVLQNKQETYREDFYDMFAKLEVQCNFVCGNTEGNVLGIDVSIPSGTHLYTVNDKICGQLKEETTCIRCACELEEYDMNLNSSIAQKFGTHMYHCYFERMEETVEINCQG